MASLCIFLIVSTMVLVHFPTGIMGDRIDVGVVYPTFAEKAPSQPEVIINLYKKYGIGKIKLYTPNPDILNALRLSDIEVAMGIINEDLVPMATSLNYTKAWFSQFVEPYLGDIEFTFIILGNEAIPGVYGKLVMPAMKNLQTVLDYNELGSISVTTAVSTNVLQYSIPPSAALFTPKALNGGLAEILDFLQHVNSYVLMVNVYPYYDYVADPDEICLDFALFAAKSPVIVEDNYNYTNLFDATLDAFYWAMERAGAPDVYLAVSETGWPTAGNGNVTTPALASIYNNNLVKHVLNYGTPKKPGPVETEAFIFGMFDENFEPNKERRNFGIFETNLEPAYPLFTTTGNKHFKAAQRKRVGRKRSRRV